MEEFQLVYPEVSPIRGGGCSISSIQPDHHLARFSQYHLRLHTVFGRSKLRVPFGDLKKRDHFLALVEVPSWKLTYPSKNALLKMIFLFHRWDMLVPWDVVVVARSNFESPNYGSWKILNFHFIISRFTVKTCGLGIQTYKYTYVYIYIHI